MAWHNGDQYRTKDGLEVYIDDVDPCEPDGSVELRWWSDDDNRRRFLPRTREFESRSEARKFANWMMYGSGIPQTLTACPR
jgi:hypothetical protein